MGIADELQDTTVDAMIVGHTHRISNLMRGNILITEGINAGTSYSVLQLMIKGGDVAWAGGATRVAKNLGVAQRADVKAIVDDANAKTAVLRNQVIGTQSIDILRAPTRLNESAMGNMVADAMRDEVPGRRGGVTPTPAGSGRTSCSPRRAPANSPVRSRGARCSRVLPFGNRTTILTLTGARPADGVRERLLARSATRLITPGRFPQVSGLKADVPLQRHDARGGRDLEDAERSGRAR